MTETKQLRQAVEQILGTRKDQSTRSFEVPFGPHSVQKSLEEQASEAARLGLTTEPGSFSTASRIPYGHPQDQVFVMTMYVATIREVAQDLIIFVVIAYAAVLISRNMLAG